MNGQQITFIVVGTIALVACIPMFIWFWRSYKYPVSENEIAYSGWFSSWLKKNKATFILLFTIVLLFVGIALVSCGNFPMDTTDVQ